MGLPDWDQRQREEARRIKMWGKVEKHHDFATDRTRFRYIDPKDGRYYDEEVDGWPDDLAMQMAMKVLAERVEVQRKLEAEVERARRDQDAIEGRDLEKRKFEFPDPRRMEYPKYEDGKYFTAPPAKATLHKDAHFPTKWIGEAIDRAEQSSKCITFTFEREGIVVMAMEAGEQYAVKVTDWQAMEKSEVNPLLHAIDEVERKLDILQSLKDKVRGH